MDIKQEPSDDCFCHKEDVNLKVDEIVNKFDCDWKCDIKLENSENRIERVDFICENIKLEVEEQATDPLKYEINGNEMEEINVFHCARTIKSDEEQRKKRKPQKRTNKNSAAYLRQREKANARKRKFLAKMTAEQRELKRAKDKEYYRKKKAERKIKSITEMSEREKCIQRKIWRQVSKKYRDKKKMLANVISDVHEPPEINIAELHFVKNMKSDEETKKVPPKKQTNKDNAAYLRHREKANARKQRFLAKMTLEQKEIKRTKDKEYYQKRKAERKIKSIRDMSEQEKCKQRTVWKKFAKKYRERRKTLANQINDTNDPSEVYTGKFSCAKNMKHGEDTRKKRPPNKQVYKDGAAYVRQREKANARKRTFLARMTLEKKELIKAKAREYYQKRKAEQKIQSIRDMSGQKSVSKAASDTGLPSES